MAGDAFRALRERLEEYRSSGDPGVLLDHQVPDEVTALRATIGWPAFGPRPAGAAIARDRFEISGRAKDAGNAVTVHRQALAAPVPDAEDQAGHLANYSSALLARFEQHGRGDDLDAAVAAAREAVAVARAAAADPSAP